MLNSFDYLLCFKLCWHNRPGPIQELDKIGVQVEKNEIVVNDQLQTHVKHILL